MEENKKKFFSFIEKFVDTYKFLVVTIATVILLLIILNLFGSIAINILKPTITTGPFSYSDKMLLELYPEYSLQESKQLLEESWGKQSLSKMFGAYMYDENTQFREKPRKGKFVNIDPNGFRKIKNQCDYPVNKSNFNIFVFGGSTTFSSGAADEQTIPSHLQEILRKTKENNSICVYNFGRPFYVNVQEKELFESLLMKGSIPDRAIFIDGLNEPNWELANTARLRNFMEGHILPYIIGDTSLMKIIRYLSGSERPTAEVKNKTTIEQVAQRYYNSKTIIESMAKTFNVCVHFVIQPIPVYNCNMSYNIVYKYGKAIPLNNLQGPIDLYTFFAKSNITTGKNNYIWLADMQLNETNNSYVDGVHYNSYFNNRIAEEIAKEILNKRL